MIFLIMCVAGTVGRVQQQEPRVAERREFGTRGRRRPEHGPALAEVDVPPSFARMAACGLNAVRAYPVPPSWLLDLARRHGLRVMVVCPWNEHAQETRSSAQEDRAAAVRWGEERRGVDSE